MISRKETFPVEVGPVKIGGGSTISIQSMTNTKTEDLEATRDQVNELARSGCDIVRVAVPNEEACQVLPDLIASSEVPIVADIHFDYRLAINAIKNGAAKIRINPGNIGSEERLQEVVATAKLYHTPIRIGINAGSLEKQVLNKYGGPTYMAMVESAVNNLVTVQKMGFNQVVLSLKASDVLTTIRAYQEFSRRFSNPLHIGITEAGTMEQGTIKSCIGIGSLLGQGIGDTVRVSLSGSPVNEVRVAKKILCSLGLRTGPEVIACPTCGRTNIQVSELASEVENRVAGSNQNITIAVMGCAVNGPGEAKEADFGIAGGNDYGILFRQGKVIKKVKRSELLYTLEQELNRGLYY